MFPLSDGVDQTGDRARRGFDGVASTVVRAGTGLHGPTSYRDRVPQPSSRTATARRRLPVAGVLAPVPTAAVAALTLVVAFAVAQLTEVRALGGLVLAAGVTWCAVRSLQSAGAGRVVAVVLVGAACFVGAHLLAQAINPWLSVLLAAGVLGGVAWLLVDTRPAAGAPADTPAPTD